MPEENYKTGTGNLKMKLQVLVAAVDKDVDALADKMNLETDAIIVNQCNCYDYHEYLHKGRRVRCFSMTERGVGLNRNTALLHADGDICLFSDEDIVFYPGYEKTVLDAFVRNPDADLITFNFKVDSLRTTYYNQEKKRIRWYNYGRYPTYAAAARLSSLRRANVSFSLLFGGGAKYCNGEDSLFFHDCLKKGLHLYGETEEIGEEVYRESTWFKGYNEKFFVDRGVLYHYLYGRMARLFSLRFLISHGLLHDGLCGLTNRQKIASSNEKDRPKEGMLAELSFGKAYGLMKQGVREGKGK